MKYSQAEKIVRNLLPIVQKFRSSAREAVEHLAPEGTSSKVIDMALLDMYPWVFNDERLIRALSILNDRLDDGGIVTGMEFYNLMTIFYRFEPAAMFAIETAFNIKLPQPDIRWSIDQWDPE